MKFSYFLPLLNLIKADVPTNCMVMDFWGDWSFNLGLQGTKEAVTNQTNYVNLGAVTGQHAFTFSPDNKVENSETGSTGTVTFIYNQGFEFMIDNQMWWVNFYFDSNGYSCEKTSVGFVHDVVNRNWARIQGTMVKNFQGQKIEKIEMRPHEQEQEAVNRNILTARHRKYTRNDFFINKINENNAGMWKAGHNSDDEKYTIAELNLRAGQKLPENMRNKIDRSRTPESIKNLVNKAKSIHKNIIEKTGLPENLDWRNINGENFVSPVDDQGACGSCYSFAAAGLLESRARVQTNNQQQPIFSEQEIITCGKDKTYNQGCAGGFAYITAGKYAHDFGFVEESCAPYQPASRTCDEATLKCNRWSATNYQYVGGYYGATMGDGGQAMMEAMQKGPLAVGFEVLDDFRNYESGIYTHTSLKDEFNPFVEVNHAVLAVGYGVCTGNNDSVCGNCGKAGTPYWVVKNSWGTSFGMQGYFCILRGVDEVGIESITVEADIVPQI